MKSGNAKKAILFFFSLVLLIHSPAFAVILERWSDPKAYKPNPILLLHGFAAGSVKSWDKVAYFADPQGARGLRLYLYKYTQVTSNLDLSSPYLERVAFNDPNGSIDTYPAGKLNPDGNSKGWADKIDDRIKLLLPIYKFKGGTPLKFTLICHSMGGLAAREYVTNPKYINADVKIDKIVTIGTPHAGSPIANVKTIENAAASEYKYIWEVPYYGKTIVIRRARESNSLIILVRSIYKIDFEGEAIKDVAIGSPFLMALKNRPFSKNIKKYAIYGEISPLSAFRYLNLAFFKQYYPSLSEEWTCGDGIVPRDSQRGYDIMTEYPSKAYWVWQPDKIAPAVQADHITELESKETYQALLQFLDSTQPEFEITSPDPNKTTEITQSSVHITGKVYKEYLPADSQLIITLTKQEDGKLYPPQTNLLKPSDLWIPNNPDSPVAEFDEVVNFPGNGTYEISCQLKNPAGITSEIKKLKVKVSGLVTSIIVHCHNPEGKEINSIQGVGNAVEIYDGSTRLGYSASNSSTHNKPITLKEGSHTIKAIFNGTILSQEIYLNRNEAQIITFTFSRTDITDTLFNWGSFPVSLSKTKLNYHIPYMDPPEGIGNHGSEPNATVPYIYEGIEFYYPGRGDIKDFFTLEVEGTFTFSYPNWSATAKGRVGISPIRPGDGMYLRMGYSMYNSLKVLSIPKFPDFINFYIQANILNSSEEALNLDMWHTTHSYEGIAYIEWNNVGYHIAGLANIGWYGARYNKPRGEVSTYFNVGSLKSIWYEKTIEAHHSGGLSVAKCSSVPYDLLGTGV